MTPKIDEEQVLHIARLARLKPNGHEVERFADQLSAILAYVDQLSEVDTTDVPPTAHALPVHNVFRNDEPHPSLSPDQALANAPQREGSFFALPKVLDQGSGA